MLGSRLIYLRKQKGKTQQDIAKVIGITRPAYTAYETGKRNPDYDTLEKIADYYDVSTDYLLGRSDSPTLSPIDKDEEEFQAFANSPDLQKWYKELPKSPEEDLKLLRAMWETIKKSR
ncbi:helix-turn-helix domain-containing protein [Viridibacillus sp. NPDC096237]|uniref:helix-turn-helix domain-containing protein n=1 Tax=Viridibacillus sp. NPDC096237 TaxID=3390721 RepID=UPI003D0095AB